VDANTQTTTRTQHRATGDCRITTNKVCCEEANGQSTLTHWCVKCETHRSFGPKRTETCAMQSQLVTTNTEQHHSRHVTFVAIACFTRATTTQVMEHVVNGGSNERSGTTKNNELGDASTSRTRRRRWGPCIRTCCISPCIHVPVPRERRDTNTRMTTTKCC